MPSEDIPVDSMNHERLNHLAVLRVHRNRLDWIVTGAIAREFVAKMQIRHATFGRFKNCNLCLSTCCCDSWVVWLHCSLIDMRTVRVVLKSADCLFGCMHTVTARCFRWPVGYWEEKCTGSLNYRSECTKMCHFKRKICKNFWGGGTAPSPDPTPGTPPHTPHSVVPPTFKP